MEEEDKFEEERQEILAQLKNGIESNIPLQPVQKKYVKNLFLFSLMRASANQTVSKQNFVRLVLKQFKKYLITTIYKNLKKMPQYSSLDDEAFLDENIEVTINNIEANERLLNLYDLQQTLTPKTIMGQIRTMVNSVSTKQILSRLLALREGKMNHRETPEEIRERQERQRQRERQRERALSRVHVRERGGRSY